MSNVPTARTPVSHTDHRLDSKEPPMPDYDLLDDDARDEVDAERAASASAFLANLRGYEARP